MQDFYLLNREYKIARFFNLGKVKDANLMLKNLRAELYGKQLVISLNRIAKQVKNPKSKLPVLKKAVDLNEKDVRSLTAYAIALVGNKQIQEAFEIFERALKINEKNTITLNSYGKALAENGAAKKAFEIFERALKINEKNTTTLNSYGKALAENGKFDEALDKIKQADDLDPNNSIILATYGVVLASKGELEAAFSKFEQSLQYNKHSLLTLTNYGKFLMQAERFEDAIDKFEQALKIAPKDYVVLFFCANALQFCERYSQAIEKYEEIHIERLPQGLDSLIFLMLGRLYYQIGQADKADTYLDKVIQKADDKDAERLRVAQNLLSVERQSDRAFEILRDIQEHTPAIQLALFKLIPSLKFQNYFTLSHPNADIAIKDTAALNRGIYHKIQNQIAIFKDIAHEIIEDDPSADEKISPILTLINTKLLTGIKDKRHLEQEHIKTIPHDDYQQILALISNTAHHIVDFVNNKLSAIREDVWEILEDLTPDEPRAQFDELLKYLKSTQAALNDLKAVNEGIRLKNEPFKIKELFTLWQNTNKIRHAKLVLNIQNPNSEFVGDIEKIKSFISELVENSLKHNADRKKLKITISSEDNHSTSRILSKKAKNVPSKNRTRKSLLITVRDNGKGIPLTEKAKIFLPLFTTIEEGTGLGLFMIKRTLEQMEGAIIEKGEHGAFFFILVPYQ
jgi:tetratricopeptide (TPR) repeat protein